jgi:thiol:disulfide interchange protein
MLPNPRWGILLLVALFAAGCGSAASVDTSTGTGDTGTESAGVEWRLDYEAAAEEAEESGKPIMIDVFAEWCGPCQMLDEQVWPREDVTKASEAFVPVKIDGDKHPDLAKKFSVNAYPTIIFLSSDGEEVHRHMGAPDYRGMLIEMGTAAEKAGVSLPE